MAKEININEETVWVLFENHNLRCENLCERIEGFILNRLKPGFSHVALIKKSRIEGCFTVIDPYSTKLAVFDVVNPNFIDELLEQGANLIETHSRECCCSFKGLITCVSVAKYFLGIKNWRIVTPWQLYQFLVKE